ncbi:UNVERIFIED_CONTAM: hypothetical protein FKN15_062448 [Acipenser sinensis]
MIWSQEFKLTLALLHHSYPYSSSEELKVRSYFAPQASRLFTPRSSTPQGEGPLSAKRGARRAHLKSLENEKQQTEEEELVLKSLEMSDESELQEQYEEALQSVKQLEVQQGVLCFEVDWLRDVLEGTEEQLAEAERQSRDAYLEMERERQAKQELEGTVRRLLQELERLREARTGGESTAHCMRPYRCVQPIA